MLKNVLSKVLSVSLFVLLPAFAGCAGEIYDADALNASPSPYDAGAQGASVVLGIWVQDDPDLSPTLAVDGCDFWQDAVTTISCMSVPREEAHIRIYANPILCPPAFDEDGKIVGSILATAYGGQGTVVVNTDCLWRPFGVRTAPQAEQFRNMVAHEIGHVLGLWEHIPRECTDAMGDYLPDTIFHPSGAPICGPAIMNPFIDVALSRLTGPDILQFDRRSLNVSVLPVRPMADMDKLGKPSCSVIGLNR